MKKLFILIVVTILISCGPVHKSDDLTNGIMIDCSRLLEKHEYYYELVDFMTAWNMNTLLLHFSDDHGISIRLPGFEKLAHPKAFTSDEIKNFVAYANAKNIDVIPELEIFGHTRYITDHPDYQYLYVGDKNDKIVFNALDPLNPKSIDLMRSMIKEVALIFPSKYFHLGCDEVNLAGLNLSKEEEVRVWTDYVNSMMGIARENGKTPMIWDDHVRKNLEIAKMLDKNVVLVEWNYSPDYKPTRLDTLAKMGYKNIIMAPSISCWRNRVIPTVPQLKNVEAHAESVRRGTATGLINTVWLPMRYLQNSMWYGMAYSAYLVNSGKEMELKKFHEIFVRKTFDVKLNNAFDDFLISWTMLHLDRRFYMAISSGNLTILNDTEKLKELKEVQELSSTLIKNAQTISVCKNAEIFESMVLSAEIINVLSEGLLLISDNNNNFDMLSSWETKMASVMTRAKAEWDEGRFPDDPAKIESKFSNLENSHLLVLLKKIESQLSPE
jgi:hypothetical protein